MAFRASNIIPSTQYDRAKQLAIQLKRQAETRSASFASGATSVEVLALVDNLNSLRAGLEVIRQVPGIADYAAAQEDDVAYDVVAEFNAMIAAAAAVVAEIVTTLPKDGSDWLLIRKINPDGSLSPRNFTAANLSSIRTLLDAVAASIA